MEDVPFSKDLLVISTIPDLDNSPLQSKVLHSKSFLVFSLFRCFTMSFLYTYYCCIIVYVAIYFYKITRVLWEPCAFKKSEKQPFFSFMTMHFPATPRGFKTVYLAEKVGEFSLSAEEHSAYQKYSNSNLELHSFQQTKKVR